MAIETLRPNEDGETVQLSRSSGNFNWEMVDDVVGDPDEDATYVYELGSYAKGLDLYNLPAHSEGSGTINKITVYFRCRWLVWEAWARAAIRVNGISYLGSQEALGYSWTTYSKEWAQNPSNAHTWTWDEIDALRIGVELENGEEYDEESQCTQVYVVVDYTVAVEGWTHKYLGVANADIAKINGVAIADILKVNGVE